MSKKKKIGIHNAMLNQRNKLIAEKSRIEILIKIENKKKAEK